MSDTSYELQEIYGPLIEQMLLQFVRNRLFSLINRLNCLSRKRLRRQITAQNMENMELFYWFNKPRADLKGESTFGARKYIHDSTLQKRFVNSLHILQLGEIQGRFPIK